MKTKRKMTKSPVALAKVAFRTAKDSLPAYSHRFSPKRGIAVHITDFQLWPAGVNDAYNIAVGVPDVDGDWRESDYGDTDPPPNMPTGQKRWWYNPPTGDSSGIQHSVNFYDNDTYDASFGIRATSEDLAEYMSGAVTHYWIRTGASTGTWKAKRRLGASDKVKWKKIVDDGTPGPLITWPPFP